MSNGGNNNSNINNTLKPTPFYQQQPQKINPQNNNNASTQQQQTTVAPHQPQYHHLHLLAGNQQKNQTTSLINNYHPYRDAFTPRNFYPQLPVSVLFPHDNNNLFDLKNPLLSEVRQNSLVDLSRSRSSSLNNTTIELKAPSFPAPQLPNDFATQQHKLEQQKSDDLIDLSNYTTTGTNLIDDMSLFDPLFVPPVVAKPKELIPSPMTPPATFETKATTPPSKAKSDTNQISPADTIKTILSKQQSLTDKPERNDKFEFIEKSLSETVSDIKTFEVFINDLKDQISSTTENNNKTNATNLTNSVIVFSPLLEQPILSDIDIKFTIRHFDVQLGKMKQINLCVPISFKVETFLDEILSRFELKDVNVNSYLLKIHGKEEYLPMKEILGELKYIQDCICLNKDPVFILIEVKNINRQLSMNANKINELTKTSFSYQILDNQVAFRNKLETLFKNILRYKEEIDRAVQISDQNQGLENFCHNFKLQIRELIKLIHKINYTFLIDLAEQLDLIELDLKSIHSKFERSELSKKLSIVTNNAISASIKFCNCASKSFDWPFKLKSKENDEFKTEKRDILKASEKFTVFVDNINNLSNFMSNLSLQLK